MTEKFSFTPILMQQAYYSIVLALEANKKKGVSTHILN